MTTWEQENESQRKTKPQIPHPSDLSCLRVIIASNFTYGISFLVARNVCVKRISTQSGGL